MTVSAEEVSQWLARALVRRSNAATPDEDEVGELTRWINIYLDRPWTPETVGEYRSADRLSRRQRATLDQAAAILQADLNVWCSYILGISPDPVGRPYRDLARTQIASLRAAIATLKEPCGSFEHGLPRTSDSGPNPKPWSIVAIKLAAETLLALQQAQRRQGHKVQAGFGDRDGPLVKSVWHWLSKIYGKENIPTRATVLETLTNNLHIGQKEDTRGIRP